jgi:hypothetical protein
MTRKTLCIALVGLLAGCLVGGCVIKDEDPCEGVDCSGNGVCSEDANGEPMCTCDEYYHVEGLQCIFDGYSVSVDWTFGPDAKSCTQVQVTDVYVQILENDVEVNSSTVNCQAGGAVIDGVYDGLYSIYLLGLNADGEEWYRAWVDFEVAGFDEDLGAVNLDAFGFMAFYWTFGVDEWDCTIAGVDRVRVMVNNVAQTENLFTADPIPQCEDLGVEITNWEMGEYNLVLEGVCESDLTTGYSLDVNVEVLYPGENDYGTLILQDVGGCL